MSVLGAFLLLFTMLAIYGAGFWRGWMVGRDHAERSLAVLVEQVLR